MWEPTKEGTILGVQTLRPAVLTLALTSAGIGMFLAIVSMAEFPSERRFILELILIAPISFYAAARLKRLVR